MVFYDCFATTGAGIRVRENSDENTGKISAACWYWPRLL